MINYKAQRPKNNEEKANDENYHKYSLLTVILWFGTFDHFMRFIDFVGEQSFIDNAFYIDQWGTDPMQRAVERKNLKFIQYMLSFEEIKKQYLQNNDLMRRLSKTLVRYNESEEIFEYIVNKLQISKEKFLAEANDESG